MYPITATVQIINEYKLYFKIATMTLLYEIFYYLFLGKRSQVIANTIAVTFIIKRNAKFQLEINENRIIFFPSKSMTLLYFIHGPFSRICSLD